MQDRASFGRTGRRSAGCILRHILNPLSEMLRPRTEARTGALVPAEREAATGAAPGNSREISEISRHSRKDLAPRRGACCCPTRHPSTPHTLHSIPHTPHSRPYTLHPAPHTPHPTTHTLHATPYTLLPTPDTRHPTPGWRVRTASRSILLPSSTIRRYLSFSSGRKRLYADLC